MDVMHKLTSDIGMVVVVGAAICSQGDNAKKDKIIDLGKLPRLCD
jgi:hypothetical protein